MITSRKNLWLSPNQICIIKGNAVAQNLMFETQNDHKLFLKMWNKYLGGMTEVIQYHLSPTDWTIMFKTKSKEKILRAYKEQRKKSKKAKPKCTLQEPKRILSEHVRIFLSQYVRLSNLQNGRKGTRVLERFRKYILKSEVDYQKIFSYITQQVRIPVQSKNGYRADEGLYDINKEVRTDGILRVGNDLYRGVCCIQEGILKCMNLIPPGSSVLRKFFSRNKLPKKPFNSS